MNWKTYTRFWLLIGQISAYDWASALQLMAPNGAPARVMPTARVAGPAIKRETMRSKYATIAKDG